LRRSQQVFLARLAIFIATNVLVGNFPRGSWRPAFFLHFQHLAEPICLVPRALLHRYSSSIRLSTPHERIAPTTTASQFSFPALLTNTHWIPSWRQMKSKALGRDACKGRHPRQHRPRSGSMVTLARHARRRSDAQPRHPAPRRLPCSTRSPHRRAVGVECVRLLSERARRPGSSRGYPRAAHVRGDPPAVES